MSSFEFILDGETVTADLRQDGATLSVTVGDREYVLTRTGANLYATTLNGTRKQIAVVRHRGKFYVDIDSVVLEVTEASDDVMGGAAGEDAEARDKIFAPMPGKIVKMLVEVGDRVATKQPLVIVEAMKMENQVNALADGTVKAINFAPGDQVDTESPIIELELAE